MPAIENVDTSYCHFVGDAHIMTRCEAPHAGTQDITAMKGFPHATPQRASRKPTAPSAGFSTDFESYV
ncbi:MAG: hypothetical protein WA823_01025 [Candidatus Acidiferrales bacterium]